MPQTYACLPDKVLHQVENFHIKYLIVSETTINQRLNFLLDKLNMKAGAFARALDLSETTVRNYVDRTSKPSSDVLEKISTTFRNVNLVWLITGQGEPFLTSDSQNPPPSTANAKFFSNSQVIGQNTGQAQNQAQNSVSTTESQQALEAAQVEIRMLREQLALANALVQAKDETILLLRGSYRNQN